MSVLVVLIPISVLIAFFFLACFIVASKNGQFDDLETPAFRMLSDGEKSLINGVKNESKRP